MKTYQIDRSRIIFEQFEDETVLVNTESGYYYSLSASGSEILTLLEHGCSVDDLSIVLFGESDDSLERRNLVEKFVDRLAGECILIERNSDRSNPAPAPPRYGSGRSFVPPVLERFDDVRDLLLIDPVHQVDREYGWPKKLDAENRLEPRV